MSNFTENPSANALVESGTVGADCCRSFPITTNEEWEAAGALTYDYLVAHQENLDITYVASGRTNDKGVLTFSNLPVALYLVSEPEERGSLGYASSPVVVRIDPFLVTVPAPSGDGDWFYDAHVYPKNSVDGVILNRASVDVNHSSRSSKWAKTTWGALEVFKHAKGNTEVGLPNAEFQVFRTEDDAKALSAPIEVDGKEDAHHIGGRNVHDRTASWRLLGSGNQISGGVPAR